MVPDGGIVLVYGVAPGGKYDMIVVTTFELADVLIGAVVLAAPFPLDVTGVAMTTVPGDVPVGRIVLVKPLSPDDNTKVLVESGGYPTTTYPDEVPEGAIVLV